MSKHHECGPSSLYRRSYCHGSMMAERGKPDTENEYSAEGDLLHNLAWVDADTRNDFGIDKDGLTTEQKMLLSCVDSALNEIAVKYGVEEWHGESQVKVIKDGKVLTYGTIDAWGRGQDRIVICDFKFGYKEVSAPAGNLQLAAYSVGIQQREGAKKVTACIIQPRIMGSKYTSYTFEKFDEITNHIENVVNECNKADAKRCAGAHCEYCKAQGDCPEFKAMSDSIAETKPAEITVDTADDIYEKACLVEKQIKAIKAQCKKIAIDNGGRAGRLEITEQNGDRCSDDLQKTYEAFQDIIDVKTFLQEFCDLKVGKFEDYICKKLVELKFCETLKSAREKFSEVANLKHGKSKRIIKLKK